MKEATCFSGFKERKTSNKKRKKKKTWKEVAESMKPDLPVQDTLNGLPLTGKPTNRVLCPGSRSKEGSNALPLQALFLEARAAEPQPRKMSSRAGGWAIGCNVNVDDALFLKIACAANDMAGNCRGNNAESPTAPEASICTCMPTGQFSRFKTRQDCEGTSAAEAS